MKQAMYVTFSLMKFRIFSFPFSFVFALIFLLDLIG